VVRYFDGRQWTHHTAPTLEPAKDRGVHPVLPLQVAMGAVVVLIGSLIASRYLLEYLVRFEWPIAVYALIGSAVGYGPSVWWCVYASRRWGTGRLVADVGVRFRWSDAGWGPLTWLAALGCEIVVLVVIEIVDIPLVSNTEGIGELDVDRTYVISLLITAVVAAPFVEEMVFRGLMLRGLRSRLGAVAAVGVQGGLFGLAHVDPVRGTGNVGLVLVLAAVGVAFGGAAYLLRRIGPTIIAHAIFNGIVMAVVLTR
jgi:membrane protease YdiL (CAAX protease family)